MQNDQRRKRVPSGQWKSPCLTTMVMLMIAAVTAAAVQRGILGTGSIKPVLMAASLAAGALGAFTGERGEGHPAKLLLGPAIPAVLLTAAILLAGDGGNKAWPLSCVLLMMLPGVCRLMAEGRKGRRRRRRRRRNG